MEPAYLPRSIKGDRIFSLIIPTYNEEKIIRQTIEKVMRSLKNFGNGYELIISDDCSKDKTVEIVKGMKKRYKNLRLIENSVNRGRGEAVSEAFLKARGDILAFMDADLSTDLEHLPSLASYIQDGFDISIGSRWKNRKNVYRTRFRMFTSFLYNNFVKITFESKIDDHECGFKSFKKDVFLDLVNRVGIKESNERGVAWDTEVLVEAQRRGYKIKEFPVKWKESKKSEIKILKEGIKVFKHLSHLRIKYFKDDIFRSSNQN